MGKRRKVFICRDCEGVYADQAVSQCDCLGGEIYDEAEIISLGVVDYLLEALERIVFEDDNISRGPSYDSIEKARAAIAKARGEA